MVTFEWYTVSVIYARKTLRKRLLGSICFFLLFIYNTELVFCLWKLKLNTIVGFFLLCFLQNVLKNQQLMSCLPAFICFVFDLLGFSIFIFNTSYTTESYLVDFPSLFVKDLMKAWNFFLWRFLLIPLYFQMHSVKITKIPVWQRCQTCQAQLELQVIVPFDSPFLLLVLFSDAQATAVQKALHHRHWFPLGWAGMQNSCSEENEIHKKLSKRPRRLNPWKNEYSEMSFEKIESTSLSDFFFFFSLPGS